MRILLLLTLLPFTSYGQYVQMDITLLEGCWTTQHEDGRIEGECWEQTPCGLEGFGFRLEGSDTTIAERLNIVEVNGSYVYIASPYSAELPTSFFERTGSESSIEFHNRKHDFPNTIRYSFSDDRDQVTVEVLGFESPNNFTL